MYSYSKSNVGLKNVLFRKIKKKLLNLRDSYIPYQLSYRPKSICASTKEYAQQTNNKNFRYIKIYTDYQTKVKVPQLLFEALSAHHVHDELDPSEQRTFIINSTYSVVAIPKGRLYTNNSDTIAYVTEEGVLLEDISYQWQAYKKIQLHPVNRFLTNRYYTTPQQIQGRVFSMVAGSSAVWNYSHWLLDTLPRIHLLKEAGLFDKIDYFVVPSYTYDFQQQSLAMLGIGPEKIIEASRYTHLQADTLIVCSHPRGKKSYLTPQWLVTFLKKEFADKNPSTTFYPPYIYISRKDASYRYVENEEALINMLITYGFQPFVLSSLSFSEKVKLFNSAKIIISITGAGLNNYAFCESGTKVVEMFAEGFVHTIFCDIAQKAGLEYYPLVYKTGSTASTQIQGMVENITVDIEEIQTLVDKWIKPNKVSAQV